MICIGLQNPKNKINVGSILRICGNFNVNFLAIRGLRYHKCSSDTNNIVNKIPLIQVNDLKDIIPFDCIPVAVDLLSKAKSIINYKHPKRAFYIFGPEDGILGKQVTNWCRDIIYVPTEQCMNLAISVAVILYDRLQKEWYEEFSKGLKEGNTKVRFRGGFMGSAN